MSYGVYKMYKINDNNSTKDWKGINRVRQEVFTLFRKTASHKKWSIAAYSDIKITLDIMCGGLE